MINKSKNGISLIVLVITIIVMIILAGAIIVTLSNTGIMNKANQAVDVTDMKQIETLASTLWADAYLDGARTKEDLEKAVKDGLAANKITEKHYEGYELHVTTTGVVFKYIDPALNHKGIIPEGGIYYVGVTTNKLGDYTGATATYNAGDEFPETVTTGDVYVYGDYEYRYNSFFTEAGPPYWALEESQLGWGVKVLDKTKTLYGEILCSINDKPIKALIYTFIGCGSLTIAPAIPNTVEGMSNTFNRCTSLTEAPIIPAGVNHMLSTFNDCTSLTGTIVINANPSVYNNCFALSSAGKDITLAGLCSAETKQNLANTSNSSYRKVYDEAGTLLK